MLALAGTFVYLRVSQELSDSIDEGLASRTDELAGVLRETRPSEIELGSSEDPEDTFSQIVRANGSLIDSTSPALGESVLNPSELGSLRDTEVGLDVGPLPGVDGDVRLLAHLTEIGAARFAVIAGAATQDRDETLAGLVTTFAIAAPLALLIASATGYALATVAMRPVERMRRQAGAITLNQGGERLALPASRDEINRLGRTLNEMLARIESSLDRERSFVADASHELRTPLAVLRGELELGLHPDRSLAEARAAMISAQEEVARLQGLTDDLLALARSDDLTLPIERTVVAIPALLESIGGRFRPRARAQGREVVVGTASPATAQIDLARIEGALGNLVENSLRHGDGEVTISSRADGTMVVFEVADEGDGFPDGFAAQAFERFARAETGRTTSGSGLGLAIVQAVAKAHGGTASIEPSQSGSKVIVRVPQGRTNAPVDA